MRPAPYFPSEKSELPRAVILLSLLFMVHGWAVSVGWNNGNLPGNEFRQAQTALSTLFIQREANYALAYPTPVLGRPWSVPMEFPLYQWTVVAVSNITGMPLIQTGRMVSLVCFYGALAAVFPLLGRLGLTPARRIIVLGFLLSCPLYIFYARAFLIETMVLMFSLWFLVAFGRLITAPSLGRLAVVSVLGVLAGLVKVTTLIVFLIPAGGWTIMEMYQQAKSAGWRGAVRRGGWGLAAIAMPVLLTTAWTHFADLTKDENSSATFLLSGNLIDFNFGTVANRFSPTTLAAHWSHLNNNIAGPILLITAGLLLGTLGRRWWRQSLLCLACYLAPLALFPTLNAWHDYYGVANAVLLIGAVGLGVAGFMDRGSRWVAYSLILALHGTQFWVFHQTYYELQQAPSPGGSDMTLAINLMTNPDEEMVVSGYDWDSSLPFYSGRRALMLRNGTERDTSYLNTAFEAQAAGKVTVYVARGAQRENLLLVPLLDEYYDLDPRPLFRWEDCAVYGRKDLRARMTDTIRRDSTLVGIELDPTTDSETWSLVGQEVLTADCLVSDQAMFALCSPQPWKFYSQYGSKLTEETGQPAFFAHADTRLWFKVPAGPRVLQAVCGVAAAAYQGGAGERTDGVEFTVERELADGSYERLGSLWLDPVGRPLDAGFHLLEVKMDFDHETNLVLSSGPGPAQSYSHDWAMFRSITIN